MRHYPIILLSVMFVACRSQHLDGLHPEGGVTPPGDGINPEPLEFPISYVNGKRSDVVALDLSEFEGTVYFFETTEAVLDHTPRWKTDAAFPLLPPRKAETAAREEAGRLRPDVKTWRLDTIELRPVIDDCWCYVVELHRGDIPIQGKPHFLKVPVLMNGQAVRGALQQRDLQK
jgi:hypothetical protein